MFRILLSSDGGITYNFLFKNSMVFVPRRSFGVHHGRPFWGQTVYKIGLAFFLGSISMMEARSPRQIQAKFKDLYQTALISNWKVWPAAQFINFRYIPPAYRVPFSQTCGVFWTLYLSILNSGEDMKQDKENAARKTLSS